MRQSLMLLEIFGLSSALGSLLLLGYLCATALAPHTPGLVLVAGSLG